MTIEEGFFHDIREHPEDDTPRLVYADWLDETGDDTARKRAELLRVQCRLAKLEESAPERADLARRDDELMAGLAEWLDPLRRKSLHVAVRRGLVEEVTVSPRQLLEHGDAVARLAPVAELTLDVPAEEWEAVLAHRMLKRVTRLERRSRVEGDEVIRLLAASPHVGPLRALILHSAGITERGLPELFRLDLSRLTVLNLGVNNLRDGGMEALCAAPALAGLERLGLGATSLRVRAARALASSANLHRLREINLGANFLGDEAIAALCEGRHLASLRRLYLDFNDFRDAGALALAGCPHLEQLQVLNVTSNGCSPEGREALRRRFGDRLVI